jgi:hypothetical protein
MARQAIVLSICCVASLGSSRDCAAQIFGTLSPREGRSLADDVQDPTMAKWPKWLMTLPQHHLSSLSQPEHLADAPPASAQLFHPDPIGGETYRLQGPVRPLGRRDVIASTPRRESGIAVSYKARVRVVNRLNGASAVVRIDGKAPDALDVTQSPATPANFGEVLEGGSSAKALETTHGFTVAPETMITSTKPVAEGRSSAKALETTHGVTVAPEGKITSTPTFGEHSLNVKLPGVTYPRGSATITPASGPKDRSHSAFGSYRRLGSRPPESR